MAKVPPSSRSAMTKEPIKSSSTSGGPSSASRHTLRPATDTVSQSTSRVVKSRASQTFSSPFATLSPKAHDKNDIRKACDKLLEKAEDDIQKLDEEIKRLNEEKDEQKRNYARLVQKLNADKAQGAEQLRASMESTEQAVAKSQRLESQVSQLKQQLDNAQNSYLGFVDWTDVQPILDRIRGLMSTGDMTLNDINALENKYRRKQLPGDGVIQAPWLNHPAPFGTMDPNSLSGFPIPNNFALSSQQMPQQQMPLLSGQYTSLS